MKRVLYFLILFYSTLINAAPLKNIVIFGDSLSDNGNAYIFSNHIYPPSPPYFNGRFSNNINWVERLTQHYFPNDYEKHLHNYAFGGAAIIDEKEDTGDLFTLKHEIDIYLDAHNGKAEPDSLYIVWIGANNYLNIADNLDESDDAIDMVNKGITTDLKRLADKGAKHILLVGLPDLGKTPYAIINHYEKKLSYLSEQHNARISDNVLTLQNDYPNTQWLYFDVSALVNTILTSPAEYGFTNTQDTCIANEFLGTPIRSVLEMSHANRNKRLIDHCDGFLFFDMVHPTGVAHQFMGNFAKELLDNAGVEFERA